MITKEGVVTEVGKKGVWVTTIRSKSCDSCTSRDSCGEHSNAQEMTIQVENSLNASTGDRVVVGFRTAPLLKIAFILYVFPIIIMIVGAAIGEAIAVRLGTDKSITSMVVGILFFASSFFIIRVMNNILANKKEYKPFLMRLLRSSGSRSAASCSFKSSAKPL